MKKILQLIFLAFLILSSSAAWSYTNLTPSEVHERLVQQDTLLLLDVREVYEYVAGHIAEPTGQLPLTAVNMPWSGGVLRSEYHRLPQDIDIIVYCKAGGRSVSASSFLESNGFTRIFNMTGGFSSWTFESRKNGYGDHSGSWVRATDSEPVEIICTETGDTSKVVFTTPVLMEMDSIYVELHFAYFKQPVPPNIPQSDINGLFRLTVLDQFGLSVFSGDSMTFASPVDVQLYPIYTDSSKQITNHNMRIYVPGEGWQMVESRFENNIFYRTETVLRRWYNVEGLIRTKVKQYSAPKKSDVGVFPNPFNRSLKILAPFEASVCIYDINGRLIKKQAAGTWSPSQMVSSGIFFVNINYHDDSITKKVLYLK